MEEHPLKNFFVYILANNSKTIYIGVTNDLLRRTEEHKAKLNSSFSEKYNLTRLVYFEDINDIEAAIDREKQIKGWRREKKIELIEPRNPRWRDLAEENKEELASKILLPL